MNRRGPGIFFLLLLAGCLFPERAHAYLDPGTGSMLVSAFIGIAAALFFFVKSFYYKAANLYYRLTGRAAPKEAGALVLYSEGGQYWNTFRPVVEALIAMGKKVVYLSSDPDDPGLRLDSAYLSTRCIGAGSRGFAVLNMLEADLCAMTTPGLDVLQISRSPGVKHYAHIVHSVTDAAFYKLYSFDYFDSVLCSGPHQMKSLRYLETLRGTKPKLLLETGCCYMDVMAQTLEQEKDVGPAARPTGAAPRLLVAPTWGKNGLLSVFGADLLLPLATEGYPLCIRPHPQSVRYETDLLDRLRAALAPCPNARWDTGPDPLPAMRDSDVLISDLSGIVFDYAFILERPVITLRLAPHTYGPDRRGLDAADLPWPAWELDLLPKLGAHIAPEEVGALSRHIHALPEREAFAKRMQALRAESLFHFTCAGRIAAEQLVAIQQSLHEGDGKN